MNPQQEIQILQQLISELLAGIQEILATGEVLSDDFQGLLADEISLAMDRILQLQSQGAPVLPENVPETESSMPSSNIEGFAYNPKNKRLYVRFLGEHPNPEGPVYQYENVPEQIVDLFRKGAVPARTNGRNKWGKWWKGKVPSMGASMFTLIKQGGYAYQRVA